MDEQRLHEAVGYTMDALGMKPDPWQMDVLTCGHKRLLLNCCRQAGKSTTVAILSVIESVGHDDMRVLLLAPSFRQSKLLFKTTAQILKRVSQHCIMHETTQELDLVNGSQIICLPCEEGTIRGYANVGLLVIDEAARVPDELYRAVSPMLAVSHGRMVGLSTKVGRMSNSSRKRKNQGRLTPMDYLMRETKFVRSAGQNRRKREKIADRLLEMASRNPLDRSAARKRLKRKAWAQMAHTLQAE